MKLPPNHTYEPIASELDRMTCEMDKAKDERDQWRAYAMALERQGVSHGAIRRLQERHGITEEMREDKDDGK